MLTTINYNENLKHFSYPSINQFRNVIRNVQHKARFRGVDDTGEPIYDNLAPLPKLKAVGTTKLHGTNAAIVYDFVNDMIYFQSKENIITPTKDNAGFAGYMATIQDKLAKLIETSDKNFQVIVFGEWCGGNIQKGVAISGLPKMFVVLDIRYYNPEKDEYIWMDRELVEEFKLPEHRIFNIYDYETWELEIDFNQPEIAQNKLGEITLEIEEKCPVGLAFGNEGVGEGAVWKIVDNETDLYNDSGFWMKVKGEKHSVSKVKTLANIDVEKVANIRAFVDAYVTDNRCEQSIQKLKEAGITDVTRAHLGEFIRWIHNDVVKEELDTIHENGFEVKELGSPIATAARTWFFNNEDRL